MVSFGSKRPFTLEGRAKTDALWLENATGVGYEKKPCTEPIHDDVFSIDLTGNEQVFDDVLIYCDAAVCKQQGKSIPHAARRVRIMSLHEMNRNIKTLDKGKAWLFLPLGGKTKGA